MDAHVWRVFISEVERQSKFGLMAVNDLNTALANGDVDRVWYSVQSLLIAAGNVSKLLWPPMKKHEERGKSLRQALAIDDASVLEPRTFRNHFEHFDERLEDWAAEPGARNFVDSNIGPAGMITSIGPATFLRNYDATNSAVTFRGDAYKLQPLATALQELHDRAAGIKHAR